LKTLREAAGYTQEELATMAGLSVHGVSALERGERRRPHVDTVRALSAALDLTEAARDALTRSARPPAVSAAVDELSGAALPLPLTSLLGRDAELQSLKQWLAVRSVRLVTLTGPGGAGKTRLALEVARAIAAESRTRVVFVPLAAIRTPALVAPAIAEALGLSDGAALDVPGNARVACGDRPTLLVLDNFEQVLEAAPLTTSLLSSVASLRVLVTSRAALRVRGEREFAVGPLALNLDCETTSPADLAASPAVRLFVERVRDVQPDFRLTPSNGPTVTAICQRLDRLPLALELAAPWIKVLTAEGLLRRLSHDVLLSSLGPRDLPERQQTMNATVAWSYHLLGNSERRAFRRLGALPGRFPIEAAAAVLAGSDAEAGRQDAPEAVARLMDKSLLLRAETSTAERPLYQMLETVRAYAAIELAAAGERDDAMQGLANHYTGEASRGAQALLGPGQVEWLHRMRDDLECYRSTLSWLIECDRAAEAARVAWNLMFFWLIRGRTGEGLRWYEQILSMGPLPPPAESRALLGAAAMAYTQGELDRARRFAMRALAMAEGTGDLGIAVQARNLCGHLAHADGHFQAAREWFVQSVAGFRALATSWGIGSALSGMAEVALATGEAGDVERLLDEANSVLQDNGPWFLLLALYVRAILAVRCADPDRAITLVRESLTCTRTLHDKFAFVYALVPLAAAAVLKGDHAWAARILGARDAITERTGATAVDRSVSDLQDQAEHLSRARLGPDRWAAAYAAGRKCSIDGLLKDIDGALGASPVRR